MNLLDTMRREQSRKTMKEAQLRQFIAERVLSRIAGKGERRDEALRAVIDLAIPNLDDKSVAGIAAAIPELPVSLYRKWVDMFVDRLLETVCPPQIEELCRGTPESDASLLLVYVMFMESARMERVVAHDLKALGEKNAPDAAGHWLRLHETVPTEH